MRASCTPRQLLSLWEYATSCACCSGLRGTMGCTNRGWLLPTRCRDRRRVPGAAGAAAGVAAAARAPGVDSAPAREDVEAEDASARAGARAPKSLLAERVRVLLVARPGARPTGWLAGLAPREPQPNSPDRKPPRPGEP